MTMAELSQQGRITVGVLRSSTPALFVTGVADSTRAITDVLVLRGGELTNLVLSAMTGVSGESSRFCTLYPTDINGDGVTEVPRTVPLSGDEESTASQRIDWISYDASGLAAKALSTYHAVEDGWYLRLPEGWAENIQAARTSGGEETAVTFYVEQDTTAGRTAAHHRAQRRGPGAAGGEDGRFILSRNGGVIYVGELLKGNEDWKYSVTEDQVRSAFGLITREWSAGDN